MLATYRRLEVEAEKLTEAEKGDQDPSASKKKRAREARKMAARVKAALDDGRIEEDIKGVKMEKVFSRASTKQAMIARVRTSPSYVIPCLTYDLDSRLVCLYFTLIGRCILATTPLKTHVASSFPRYST